MSVKHGKDLNIEMQWKTTLFKGLSKSALPVMFVNLKLSNALNIQSSEYLHLGLSSRGGERKYGAGFTW